MLLWTNNHFVLHMHIDHATLHHKKKGHLMQIAECPFTSTDRSICLREISTLCAKNLTHTTGSIEFIFDDSYARFWHVTPPINATRFSDLKITAQLRFETLFNLPSTEWVIEADWNIDTSFLACALPQWWMEELYEIFLINAKKIHTIATYPYFIQQWNQYAFVIDQPIQGFAVINDLSATIALIHQGKPYAIKTTSLTKIDPDNLQNIEQSIHSLCLQLGTPLPQKIIVVGNLPMDWSDLATEKIQWQQLKSMHLPPQQINKRGQQAA